MAIAKRDSKRRNKRGSIITFAVILALTLVVLGSGFIFFVLFMGGQKETKNAVDAGILNAGKQAIDKISVPLAGGPLSPFADITTDRAANYLMGDGQINLRRVNRMWGKAMLIAINAAAMQSEGNVGSGASNAQSAFNEAQQVSDTLAQKLMTQQNLHSFFQDVAGQNSIRMLGNGVQIKVKSGTGWDTSLLDRGCESNLVLNGSPPFFNLPPGYTLPNNYFTKCTRPNPPAEAANLYFLKGYTPLTVGGKTFWQVPFKFDDKPHLVARSTFDANTMKNQPLNWNFAVPNAFSGEGEAIKSGPQGEKATSWMLTNPREPFQMAMPHSFVKIHVDENKSHWFYYPGGPPPLPDTEFGIAQTYGYTTETQNSSMPAGGLLCATVSAFNVLLGTDVVGRSLDGLIFGMPEGNTTAVENYLTNRCNEMLSVTGRSASKSDMHNALSNPVTIGSLIAGVRDFYLYSPDGQTLKCIPAPQAIAEPWLAAIIANTPDGTEKKVIDEASMPAPIFFVPTVVPDPFCSPKLALGWGLWKKDVAWQPGTGYNGCLGQLRVKRWTNVHVLGVSSFP